jgi:hypothetical protein
MISIRANHDDNDHGEYFIFSLILNITTMNTIGMIIILLTINLNMGTLTDAFVVSVCLILNILTKMMVRILSLSTNSMPNDLNKS